MQTKRMGSISGKVIGVFVSGVLFVAGNALPADAKDFKMAPAPAMGKLMPAPAIVNKLAPAPNNAPKPANKAKPAAQADPNRMTMEMNRIYEANALRQSGANQTGYMVNSGAGGYAPLPGAMQRSAPKNVSEQIQRLSAYYADLHN